MTQPTTAKRALRTETIFCRADLTGAIRLARESFREVGDAAALLLAAIACLLVALGCGPEEPSAPDAARTPPRILSLSREVSELLVELGLAPSVVGADHASVALPQLADAADLGDAGASGADALALAAALRPDLALFLADGEPPFARALEARGIRSYVFAPHSANDVLAAVHRLGAILGDETRTTALAARITQRRLPLRDAARRACARARRLAAPARSAGRRRRRRPAPRAARAGRRRERLPRAAGRADARTPRGRRGADRRERARSGARRLGRAGCRARVRRPCAA